MIKIHSDEFVSALNDYIESLKGGLETAMELACIEIENRAKETCPKDTGRLRQSLTHNVESTKNSVHGEVGSTEEYGVYVHEGTGTYSRTGLGRKTPWVYRTDDGHFYTTDGQKPNPFLESAADEKRGRIGQIFQSTLGGKSE